MSELAKKYRTSGPIVVTVRGKRRDLGLKEGVMTNYSFSPFGPDGPCFEAQCMVTRIVSRRRRLKGLHDIYLESVA